MSPYKQFSRCTRLLSCIGDLAKHRRTSDSEPSDTLDGWLVTGQNGLFWRFKSVVSRNGLSSETLTRRMSNVAFSCRAGYISDYQL